MDTIKICRFYGTETIPKSVKRIVDAVNNNAVLPIVYQMVAMTTPGIGGWAIGSDYEDGTQSIVVKNDGTLVYRNSAMGGDSPCKSEEEAIQYLIALADLTL